MFWLAEVSVGLRARGWPKVRYWWPTRCKPGRQTQSRLWSLLFSYYTQSLSRVRAKYSHRAYRYIGAARCSRGQLLKRTASPLTTIAVVGAGPFCLVSKCGQGLVSATVTTSVGEELLKYKTRQNCENQPGEYDNRQPHECAGGKLLIRHKETY